MNQAREVCEVLKEAYRRGWISAKDGNVSVWDHETNTLLITPSGVNKYDLRPSDLIDLDATEEGASMELAMHLGLQSPVSTEDRCVLHLHPTHIIAAMYAGIDLKKLSKEFPEVSRYTKVGPNVPKVPATSRELAEKTAKCLGVDRYVILKYDIVGQANHGVCAVGKNPWEAFKHVERLEHICQIALLAKKF